MSSRPADKVQGHMTQARDIKSGVVRAEMVLKTRSLSEVSKGVSGGREKFKDGPQGYDSVLRSGRSREASNILEGQEENQKSPGPGSPVRQVLQEERASAGSTVERRTGGLGPDRGRSLVAFVWLSMEESLRYAKSKTKQV